MKSFLEYVAEDIIRRFSVEGKAGIDLTDIAVVFPNKRASLFLNQYLYRAAGNKPIWCPHYITISELFRQQSGVTVVDQIEANCILYNIYRDIMEEADPEFMVESLDRFWSWGQMMLADFDDLDKNMGDADLIYNNVRALENLTAAPEDYLTDEQKKALVEFFHLVTDDNDSELKRNFEHLWNNLGAIYHGLNDALREKGLAYEGALYREVAERADSLEWAYKKYLFVGFNMIQTSEQRLFTSMKKQDLALFYWDYDTYYADKEAGHFINKELLTRFPNELKDKEIFNNFLRKDEATGETIMKDVTYLAASTENIQARYISDWLTEEGKHRLQPGQRTAIVLSDESLLKNVIHNLPKETSGRANITVGFPLSLSPATSLVKDYLLLHRGEFDLRKVSDLLRHPYTDFLSANAAELLGRLHTNKIFYPKKEDLCGIDDNLDLLFNPYKDAEQPGNEALLASLLKILQAIGRECEQRRKARNDDEGDGNYNEEKATYEEQFLQESIFRMYNIINRIHDLVCKSLYVDLNTLTRIIDQIVQTTSMPFHGEPAVNLQIMGVLETRNLDFDHVLLLSCNEGNLPKDVNNSSLIPYIVRKAHGLTTVDHKVAIYAYYFYRLLQRCDDICIAYNSSTEDGHTGQMSRFMLQLMVEYERMNLKKKNLIARQLPGFASSKEILKDETVMKALEDVHSLSPSIINKYLRCPLQFYYDKLAGLRESDDEEMIDNRMFGTIFHAAAEIMYRDIAHDGIITKENIEYLLSRKGEPKVYEFVDNAFRVKFFNDHEPHYDGLQTINREVIKRFIINLLKEDNELAPFRIVGLEKDVYENITFKKNDGTEKTVSVGGNIDRLDCITVKKGNIEEKVLRVVDYKTGRSEPKERESVEELFMPKFVDDHAGYLLQVMLYSMIVRHCNKEYTSYIKDECVVNPPLNPAGLAVRPSLLYIQKPKSVKDPVIKIGKKENAVSVDDVLTYETEFREGLNRLLAEIFDPEVPFMPTNNRRHCDNCCYKNLCKR